MKIQRRGFFGALAGIVAGSHLPAPSASAVLPTHTGAVPNRVFVFGDVIRPEMVIRIDGRHIARDVAKHLPGILHRT